MADAPLAQAPEAGSDAAIVSEHAFVDRIEPFSRWLTVLYGLGVLALGVCWHLAAAPLSVPLLAAMRRSGLLAVALSSLLLALTGLAGVWVMTRARRRAAQTPVPPPAIHRQRWRRWAMLRLPSPGDPALIGRVARWPQAIVVTGLALTAAGCAWLPRMAFMTAPAPAVSFILGGAAIVLAFPLLIAERLLAATPSSRLPEAPALRALLLLPVLAWPAAGLVSIATGLGVAFASRLDTLLAVILTVVAAELALRALGRCFLPPPAPGAARAAIDSALARMIAEGLRTRGIAAPVRQHFGIDFSRGWALSFLRAAIPPVVLGLLLLCWGLSGVVLVGLDERAIYERFGAPVSVLSPGLHAVLPWPMGQIRRVEFGVVHETALTGPAAAAPPSAVGAEDLPPPEADRLWEQAHPGELVFLIASETGGQQSFQAVSADIKVRYRIGLTDRDALLAAYRVAEPAALLRGAASRVIAVFFAGRTLDAVLGENREAMAERLRAELQRDLDEIDPGIELSAMVIEAIHPPAGAAEAYHAVQAAQIQATARISAEQGAALSTQAKARQYATDIVNQARAAGAEATGTAASDLTRFTADHAAALAGGESFLLERRLTSLAASLAGKTLTIVDHRIPEADAPILDLRPQSATTARSVGPDQE
jgi:regulator of protease activity HflC (stomatin/prohibitin superfamily)